MISHYYQSGVEFNSPTEASDYISSYGLEIAATYDPEGFWGQFSAFIPSTVIINLQTMQILFMDNITTTSEIRNVLDSLLGI